MKNMKNAQFLGKIMRKARNHRGLYLTELGDLIGVQHSIIGRFERGNPRVMSEKKVVDAFRALEADDRLIYRLFVLADMKRRKNQFKDSILGLEEEIIKDTHVEKLGLTAEDLK